MLSDEYKIADIAIFPWINNLIGFYAAADLVGYARFREVDRVLRAFLSRPAVGRGLRVPYWQLPESEK